MWLCEDGKTCGRCKSVLCCLTWFLVCIAYVKPWLGCTPVHPTVGNQRTQLNLTVHQLRPLVAHGLTRQDKTRWRCLGIRIETDALSSNTKTSTSGRLCTEYNWIYGVRPGDVEKLQLVKKPAGCFPEERVCDP